MEHVKSQGHEDKAKELKMLEKELAGQDEDHFITVDAMGCFKGDEEEEEEEEDEEEEIEVEEEFCKQVLGGSRGCRGQAGGWTPSPGGTLPHLPGPGGTVLAFVGTNACQKLELIGTVLCKHIMMTVRWQVKGVRASEAS